ncbi:MAG: peptidylprolyl isomerase [Planctomycetes bacterium]|nr:peptidylprolyl isomerase [Planctomycetota bacterium]
MIRWMFAAVGWIMTATATVGQDPPAMALTLAVDRTQVAVGEDFQFEVKLENTGSQPREIAQLLYEERSIGFEVSAQWGEVKKDYALGVIRPDPHIMLQLPLPKVTLEPGKSLTLLHRMPAIAVGKLTVMATYAGVTPALTSAPVSLEVQPAPAGGKLAAVVETENLGTFSIELLPEAAPANVTHFVSLVKRGFYDGLLVHRIVRGSWIQSGCPYGDGYGWPGYTVRAELDEKRSHERGTVALCSFGKSNYTGSQFYISLSDLPTHTGRYTVIGKVSESDMEKVVVPIGKKEVDKNTDSPREPIKIKSVTIRAVQQS